MKGIFLGFEHVNDDGKGITCVDETIDFETGFGVRRFVCLAALISLSKHTHTGKYAGVTHNGQKRMEQY